MNKLYAVVFKPSAANTLKPGEFSKTYEVTLTGAGTDNQTYSSATFTMDDDGLYYMYLVANPGTALEKNLTNDTGASAPLVAGTSTVNDFFALVETDRNPNDNSATNFLMTSNVVQVDIQGDGATDLTNGGSRYIELKRAAARIDIDATAIDGFELVSVQFVNRHPASVMVNTGTDNALTGENSTSTTNPTYTKPAVDDTYSFTDKWLAGIYGYENHKEAAAGDETGITQLIINGKLNGIAVSQTVDFYSKEETSPGSGTYTYTTIPLNRNTLYYVKLKPKATPDAYAPLAYTIQVANWRTGETIVFTGENLAKACKPELVSIKRQLWDETNGVWADATDLTLTTVSLDVVDNGTPRTVTDGKKTAVGLETCRLAIEVKAGTTGCNIECPELDEALSGAASTYHTGVTGADKKGLFEGEQSSPDKRYDANGNMYLTWYVQISELNDNPQSFNFTLTNQLNSENDYISHFQIYNREYYVSPTYPAAFGGLHPLERFAEGNLEYNNTTAATSFQSTDVRTCQNTGTSQNVFTNIDLDTGGKLVSAYAYKGGTGLTINGIKWYTPTAQEQVWILSCSFNCFTNQSDKAESDVAVTGTFTSDSKVADSGKEAWAIRFKSADNLYRSAYHYYIDTNNALHVEVAYIGNDASVTLEEISKAENQNYYFGKISRVFPTGESSSNNYLGANNAIYWASGTSYGWGWKISIYASSNPAVAYLDGSTTGSSVYGFLRLFRRNN